MGRLEPVLEESFEGWYLRHSLKTLHVERVIEAEVEGTPAGLAMLKSLGENAGYVYYIAVAKAFRRRKVASRLLDSALEYFAGLGSEVVFASVENPEAESLFLSAGFRKTNFGEVSNEFGMLQAMAMYRRMLSVPGEVLFRIDLQKKIA